MTLVEWMDRMDYMRGSPALWGSIEKGRKNHSHAGGEINMRMLDTRN